MPTTPYEGWRRRFLTDTYISYRPLLRQIQDLSRQNKNSLEWKDYGKGCIPVIASTAENALFPVMLRDLLRGQAQKACGVVVKNVSLLLGSQELRRIDGLDRR